jgi:hypothetical protein
MPSPRIVRLKAATRAVDGPDARIGSTCGIEMLYRTDWR